MANIPENLKYLEGLMLFIMLLAKGNLQWVRELILQLFHVEDAYKCSGSAVFTKSTTPTYLHQSRACGVMDMMKY